MFRIWRNRGTVLICVGKEITCHLSIVLIDFSDLARTGWHSNVHAQWLCDVLMLLPFQGVITFRHVNPGCRFACPGLCAPLGLQPALAKFETWVKVKSVKEVTALEYSTQWLKFRIQPALTKSKTWVKVKSVKEVMALEYSAQWLKFRI